MSEYICDQIAEKLESGECLGWLSRPIIGWMLNQTWGFPGIFAIDLDDEGHIVILNHPEDEPHQICTREALSVDIINLAHHFGLTDRERAYLLAKIPKPEREDETKPRRQKIPAEKIGTLGKDLRVTDHHGRFSFFHSEEQADVENFCRRNKMILHKNVRGEWRQIIP